MQHHPGQRLLAGLQQIITQLQSPAKVATIILAALESVYVESPKSPGPTPI
jgi:hypothetical protein